MTRQAIKMAGNHRVHPSARAERFEIENLSRVPGDAYRYPYEIDIVVASQHPAGGSFCHESDTA